MDIVSAQYFSMVSIKQINWSRISAWPLLSAGEQEELLSLTVQHPQSKSFPSSLMYRRRFLKFIIGKAEESGAEIIDDVYGEYTALLSQPETDELCFKHYRMPCGHYIAVQETTSLISSGTTGLNTWQAAFYLVEWLLEHPDVIEGKRVLELGSGLGFTGLAALHGCQPASYVFSDCHDRVLHLLAKNIQLNVKHTARRDPKRQADELRNCSPIVCGSKNSNLGPWRSQYAFKASSVANDEDDGDTCLIPPYVVAAGTVCPCRTAGCTGAPTGGADDIRCTGVGASVMAGDDLSDWIRSSDTDLTYVTKWTHLHVPRIQMWKLDWEALSEHWPSKLLDEPQIILASDVVYDGSIIPFLVSLLRDLLSSSSATAYIASTIRNPATKEEFIAALGEADITWELQQPTSQSTFYYDKSVPIEILKLTNGLTECV